MSNIVVFQWQITAVKRTSQPWNQWLEQPIVRLAGEMFSRWRLLADRSSKCSRIFCWCDSISSFPISPACQEKIKPWRLKCHLGEKLVNSSVALGIQELAGYGRTCNTWSLLPHAASRFCQHHIVNPPTTTDRWRPRKTQNAICQVLSTDWFYQSGH